MLVATIHPPPSYRSNMSPDIAKCTLGGEPAPRQIEQHRFRLKNSVTPCLVNCNGWYPACFVLGDRRGGRYGNSRASGGECTTWVLAWTACWGQFQNTCTWTVLWVIVKSQVPIHGQWVGKQISCWVDLLYANKMINYWMGSFSLNVFVIFVISPVVNKGNQKQENILQRASNVASLWWMAPWLEVLFPSWVVSRTPFNAAIVQKRSHPVF